MSKTSVPVLIEPKPIWIKEHEKCDTNFSPSDVVYMSNALGRIRIKVCTVCGYEDVECLHLNNHIDSVNIKMICLLCGG